MVKSSRVRFGSCGSSFPMLRPDTPFEFSIDNAMWNGVEGVDPFLEGHFLEQTIETMRNLRPLNVPPKWVGVRNNGAELVFSLLVMVLATK